MPPKAQFHLLGWITLLLFPLPAFLVLHYFEDVSLADFFQKDKLTLSMVLLGVNAGVFYAFIILILGQFPVFQEQSMRQVRMIRSLRLNWGDILFISICAGVGEELLFRAGMQFYLGPWITSFIFVAIHGYFSFTSWKKNLPGLAVLPFILLLAFGFEAYGLWFAIAAHATYDFVLFSCFVTPDDQSIQRKRKFTTLK
ncbi:MAG: CPBP family intramembrane metalloprotease [Crocinitomicaceae bacterium]|jgi:membrane protease YdiL (CAAX protease family)|nr:CPBP family intramembrane metalloprotease [Crocinitomicaceae bacterium]